MCSSVLILLLRVYFKGIHYDVLKDLVIRMSIVELFLRRRKVRNSLTARYKSYQSNTKLNSSLATLGL